METGVDILRAWVSRMIMLGLYVTDKVPFKDVFLHGLILDQHGQKMSKSKGNVVNPMDIIAKYGSDALRMGIVMNRSAGQAQAFSEASVVAGRNFCNKLWNIARFIEAKADEAGVTDEMADHAKPETIADHWIYSKLEQARVELDSHIKDYRFAEAMETVYHVIWDELADWYIEASKTGSNPAFMRHVLNISLRLAHPFAPFVTETIWTTLRNDNTLLILQKWPKKLDFSVRKAAEFDKIIELVTTVRNITAQLPNGKYNLIYSDDDLIAEQGSLIKSLAKLGKVKHDSTPHGLRIAGQPLEAWLELNDQQIAEYKQHLVKQLKQAKNEIDNLERRLANKGYVDKAPAKLVAETRKDLTAKKQQATHLADAISSIS